jgi:hypothetical protein
MSAKRKLGFLACLVGLSVMLSGCLTIPRASFTAAEQADAAPPGFDTVRYVWDDPSLPAKLPKFVKRDENGDYKVLALSGGGANGAYGAGLLYAWSKTGQRPTFQLVTGVSTGALMAPYAFLGPAWDEQLKQAYLGEATTHLLRSRLLLRLFTPGFYSKAPLEHLVRASVTDALLAAIAAEHAKGRQLLVGTTNLDTEQLVVWDMGAIAAKGGPEAKALFADVLIASASVPIVFAPTLIKVESHGRQFREMHVDGQTEFAFFIVPQALLISKSFHDAGHPPQVFVIVNGRFDGDFRKTPRATIPILSRVVETANKASIRSLLIANEEFCLRDGCDLYVSTLPTSIKDKGLDFSAAHLHGLFEAGEAAMADGVAWNGKLKGKVLEITAKP